MKKLSKIGLLLVLTALTFSSCKKQEEENKPANADGEALKSFIENKRNEATQDFVVDMSDPSGVTIVGEQGTEIRFSPGSLKDLDGINVTGNIDVKLIEIYSKADMLIMNKTTMGKLPNGDQAMLVSGGEFELTASQNGEDLVIDGSLEIKLPVDNTGGEDVDMELFVNNFDEADCGAIICEEDVWEEVEEDTAGQGGLFIEEFNGQIFYYGFISQFGWSNVDRFYSYAGTKTTLKVQAPEGYDATNCAIYLSYDGEESGLASLDTYLSGENVFSEHYGQIPVGLNVHVIAISIVDDEYSYTIEPWTIEENGVIVLNDLVATTEANLTTEINSLP